MVTRYHELFWPLRPSADAFFTRYTHWPGLDDYQHFIQNDSHPVLNCRGLPIRFVMQDSKPESFSQQYEPRIYLKGEVQTRLQCWHDFFQVLIWRLFPATKAALNELHYKALLARSQAQNQGKRSTLENALTQFDECGAIILATQPELLEMITEFEWKKLFWDNRHTLNRELKCIVFGHAIYEKTLNPYIGMTGHSVLIPVDRDLLHKPTNTLLKLVDRILCDIVTTGTRINSPQNFAPFPLLGIPGWHPDNSFEHFYENTQYFRSGRHFKTGS